MDIFNSHIDYNQQIPSLISSCVSLINSKIKLSSNINNLIIKDINYNFMNEINLYLSIGKKTINKSTINSITNKIYIFQMENFIQFNKLLNKYTTTNFENLINLIYKRIELLTNKQIKLLTDEYNNCLV